MKVGLYLMLDIRSCANVLIDLPHRSTYREPIDEPAREAPVDEPPGAERPPNEDRKVPKEIPLRDPVTRVRAVIHRSVPICRYQLRIGSIR
jgi:hypothetical protein